MIDALTRRFLLGTIVSLPLGDPFGSAYTGVRKSIVRSAQIADAFDRWQKAQFEDRVLGTPPPDSSQLVLEAGAAALFLGAASETFLQVRPGADLDVLRGRAEEAALRTLSNSERLAVQQDEAAVGPRFAFNVLRDWTMYRDALADTESRTHFNAAYGARLFSALLPQGGSCDGRASRADAVRAAQALVAALERGGAVRRAVWQGADLFSEDLSDSFSVVLERSAWLPASLQLQAGERRLFYPDPVGTSVAACLASCGRITTTHIEYYLDDAYRPDSAAPPTQTLIEWTSVSG